MPRIPLDLDQLLSEFRLLDVVGAPKGRQDIIDVLSDKGVSRRQFLKSAGNLLPKSDQAKFLETVLADPDDMFANAVYSEHGKEAYRDLLTTAEEFFRRYPHMWPEDVFGGPVGQPGLSDTTADDIINGFMDVLKHKRKLSLEDFGRLRSRDEWSGP